MTRDRQRPTLAPTPRAYPTNPITRRQVLWCVGILVAVIAVTNMSYVGRWLW